MEKHKSKADLLDEIDEMEEDEKEIKKELHKKMEPHKKPKPEHVPEIEKKMPRSKEDVEPVIPPSPSLDASPPPPLPLPFDVDFVPTPGLAPDPKYIQAVVKHVDLNVSKKQKKLARAVQPANQHANYPIAVRKFVDAKNRNKKK